MFSLETVQNGPCNHSFSGTGVIDGPASQDCPPDPFSGFTGRFSLSEFEFDAAVAAIGVFTVCRINGREFAESGSDEALR